MDNHHIKVMAELFDSLSIAGETVSEEDRVVNLLASLPESYNVLVTALKVYEGVPPKFEVATERILHQERKSKDKTSNPIKMVQWYPKNVLRRDQ